MKISYSAVRYYLLFIYYKIRIFVDCTDGRFRLYLSELIHLVGAIFRLSIEMPGYDRIQTIKTVWGKFYFIGDLYSYLIMNPSFERPDIEYFLKEIQKSLKQKKSIAFFDIGANVGLYSVGMTRYIQNKKLSIVAIEPDPVYHELLLKNLKENAVPNINVYHVALGDKNVEAEVAGFQMNGDRVIRTNVHFIFKRLDSIFSQKYYQKFDELFVKIDIEGNEEEALDGAKNLITSGKKIRLMIEDCVNPSIVRYLRKNGFQFIKKITPYDSFWELN